MPKSDFQKITLFCPTMRFGTQKNGIAMFHPEKAVTWTSLWIFLIALAIDCSENLFGTTFECYFSVYNHQSWSVHLWEQCFWRDGIDSKKTLFVIISNENVSDSMHFSSLINLPSCKSGKIAILMSGHEIYKSKHKIRKISF